MALQFSDNQWYETLVELLRAFNKLLNKPELVKPTFKKTSDALLSMGSALCLGRYKPENYFTKKSFSLIKQNPKKLRSDVPAVSDEAYYHVFSLIGIDDVAKLTSKPAGGIIYEDPFYAFLACFNLGYSKQLYLLPAKATYPSVWETRNEILKTLEAKTYLPESYFVLCSPASSNPLIQNPELSSIKGSDLIGLREIGRSFFPLNETTGYCEYLLFQYITLTFDPNNPPLPAPSEDDTEDQGIHTDNAE